MPEYYHHIFIQQSKSHFELLEGWANMHRKQSWTNEQFVDEEWLEVLLFNHLFELQFYPLIFGLLLIWIFLKDLTYALWIFSFLEVCSCQFEWFIDWICHLEVPYWIVACGLMEIETNHLLCNLYLSVCIFLEVSTQVKLECEFAMMCFLQD